MWNRAASVPKSPQVVEAAKLLREDMVARAHIKDVLPPPTPYLVNKTVVSPETVTQLLGGDTYQFETVSERKELTEEVKAFLHKPGKKHHGIRRGWAKDTEKVLKSVLDEYVAGAPEIQRNLQEKRFQELQAKLAPYYSVERFDEMALLKLLGRPENAAHSDANRQALTKHILENPGRPLSAKAKTALNEFGLTTELKATLGLLEAWTQTDLAKAEEYPFEELDQLYAKLRAVFPSASPDTQDRLLEGLEAFEKVLNSRDILKKFGFDEGSKAFGPITLLQDLKALRATPPKQNNSVAIGWTVAT
jgi:hypothetical protein